MPFDPTDNPGRLVLAFLLAVTISGLAWRVRALSPGGAFAATALGTAIVGFGGWRPGVLLVAFFATSSLVTRLLEPQNAETNRSSRRDAIQVLANGGAPLGLAFAAAVASDPAPWTVACLASITAAAADTWATGFGRLNVRPPRSVVTWQSVPSGTSGAVSLVGTGGALMAAVALGVPAAIGLDVTAAIPIVVIAGFLGTVADSLLGATVQQQNWCPLCQRVTELRVHRCGTNTIGHHGWRWVTNDTVNALAIGIAGGMAAVATSLVNT